MAGFEPTALRGKWFEVDDLHHSVRDTPLLADVKRNYQNGYRATIVCSTFITAAQWMD
jgi:hypothetical protein